MNIHEVYLINWLIDKNPVFSLIPPPRAALLHQAAIKSLLAKRLLLDPEHFSDEGAMIAKRLADYKSASKYVKLGDVTMGLLDNSQCVVLRRSRVVEDYTFERVDISESADQLLESYAFIKSAMESVSSADETLIDENSVKENFKLGYTNCVYLSTITITNPAVIINELIFASDGQLYLYDRDRKSLSKKDQSQIREIFKERMAV